MDIVITGVAGFIGSNVARRFQAEGYTVIGVDDLSTGRLANIPADIDFIEADLADSTTLGRLPKRCAMVLHLAGQSSGEISFDNPVSDLHKNTVSTLNLIRYGIDVGAERLIYASSMSVYGPVPDRPVTENTPCVPLSCYGVGKLAAEGYLKVYQNSLPWVALRMFNVYGPGQDMSNMRQGMVSIFLAQGVTQGTVHVRGRLDRFRDFIYIDDVVEGWYRAATRSQAIGQVLNLGTGVRTTVEELLDAIRECRPTLTWRSDGVTPGDQFGVYAETSRLTQTLDLQHFVPLSEGVHRFHDWYAALQS